MVKKPQEPREEVLASMEKGALLNSTRHGGKADVGAVIGRALAEFPDLRSDPAQVAKAAQALVKQVNSMSLSQQEALLSQKYPGAEQPVQKEGRVGLPPLPNAVKGKAAFRLPPEPSGFMTVGHAMAFTINFLYRQEYDGELWLRFEDTNPRKVEPRYYESFRSGSKWLGVEWDHEKNVSDDIETIYAHGRRLLEEGKAYACSCDADKVKKLRFEGKACEHRDSPADANLRVWVELLAKKHKEGDYVIRFKGDMQNVNYSLRDTNIFRVIDHPHPLTGEKYSLWPTYDLANAVEDEICGITHILRSSEFRNELQQLLREALGLRAPEVIQFSRFNFKGTPVSKRLLRPLVEQKLVSGWDDPRMPTVEGLKRRGVLPQAIRDFTLQVGYTKTEHEYDWSILLSINRKLLDPVSKRLFFVPDPVELSVKGAPERKVTIPYHPQNDLGSRTIQTAGRFYIAGGDLKAIKEGSVFRLMDLYNVKLTSAGPTPTAEYAGDELLEGTRKFQWATPARVEVKVLAPDVLFDEKGEFNRDSLKEVRGYVEEAFTKLKAGDIVQFPRFGFCRLDSPGTMVLSA
ncbi:MAG: glutamate--tRNA ligase [Thaumarchaeota archaeon]|nr:glutamate--tRNA ligase [Nitrososphaerota archaeon]